ncbi:MAG: glycosyltransferase family 2 protein [Ignavibacteriaceae bacterium]|nr:glycosyltransferase family 2 protein [Ignavibacteriaceae bacterium]
MNKLSVIIIAGNEERNIRDCLKSASFADEIVVVDSFSTDKTVEIAREYTPKVYQKKWEGYAVQKRYSLEMATHEWVMSLDADERITPALKDEILGLMKNEPQYDGYYIPRKTYFNGKWIKSCGWYPGYQLRLFRKSKTTVTTRLVHEGFEVDGKTGRLKGDIDHFTHESIEQTIKKINHYSSLEAEEKWQRKHVSGLSIILHPIAAFFNHYIVKRGITDGIEGLMISVFHAMTNLMTYMKMYERKKTGKQ